MRLRSVAPGRANASRRTSCVHAQWRAANLRSVCATCAGVQAPGFLNAISTGISALTNSRPVHRSALSAQRPVKQLRSIYRLITLARTAQMSIMHVSLARRTVRRAARRSLAGRESSQDGVMTVRGAAAEALDTASRIDDTAADVAPDVIEPAHGDSGLGHLDERACRPGMAVKSAVKRAGKQKRRGRQRTRRERKDVREGSGGREREVTIGGEREDHGRITRVRIECAPANRLCLLCVRYAQPARLLAINLKDLVWLYFGARRPTRIVAVREVSALKHQ
jgi:hypothetical protein